jgi:hypothetical protein
MQTVPGCELRRRHASNRAGWSRLVVIAAPLGDHGTRMDKGVEVVIIETCARMTSNRFAATSRQPSKTGTDALGHCCKRGIHIDDQADGRREQR